MSYKNKRENPINFVLKTKYDQGKRAIRAFKSECFDVIEQKDTNRGAEQTIYDLLETKFPGFKDHFPLTNWKQKKKLPNGNYKDVIVSKDFDSSLKIYSKSITSAVSKYGRKSVKKMNKTMEKQLNINSFVEQPEPLKETYSDTINGLLALARQGAKSCKTPDGWDVQF